MTERRRSLRRMVAQLVLVILVLAAFVLLVGPGPNHAPTMPTTTTGGGPWAP